jgi:hypothetical protein
MKTIFLVQSGYLEDTEFMRAFADKKKAERFFLKKYGEYYPSFAPKEKFSGCSREILGGHKDYGTWCQLLEVKL